MKAPKGPTSREAAESLSPRKVNSPSLPRRLIPSGRRSFRRDLVKLLRQTIEVEAGFCWMESSNRRRLTWGKIPDIRDDAHKGLGVFAKDAAKQHRASALCKNAKFASRTAPMWRSAGVPP